MKDYTLKQSERSGYILYYEECTDGTLNIYFADGTVFRGIANTRDNIEKLDGKLNKQAIEAMGDAKYKFFSDKADNSKAAACFVPSGIMVAGVAASFIPAINNAIMLNGGTPIRVAGVGLITLFGSIPTFAKMVRDTGKKEELDKLIFIRKNYELLSSFRRYSNSLAGISSRTIRRLRSVDDPFSIVNIDIFTLDDLKRICKNIIEEKKLQLTYKRRTR